MKFYQDFLQRIDIDRLHRNVEGLGEFVPKGDGKSTAILSLMLGEVWCGDPKNFYLYVGNDENHAEQALKQFAHIVRSEGPLVQFLNHDTINVGQSFRFIGVDRFLSDAFAGAEYARVFVDVRPIFFERIEKCAVLAQICERRWGSRSKHSQTGE